MKVLGRSIRFSSIGEWTRRPSQGQAIVIIAFVFIGLIAFVGLVVDVGVVLTRFAQLRRAVDASAVQASNQFRESRILYDQSGSGGDIFASVQQTMAAHGFDTPEGRVRVFACINAGADLVTSRDNSSPPFSTPDAYETPDMQEALRAELCFDPPRKLVRVDGEADVGLPFLSIVGWRQLTIKAQSTGEAAAIDFAIVLDRSSSMARDVCSAGNNYGGSGSMQACSAACSASKTCHPFEEVRDNAKRLVTRLKFPQDRVAIIQFDRDPYIFDTATNTFVSKPNVIAATMMISDQQKALDVLDNYFSIQTNCGPITGVEPTSINSCGLNTNIGGAIRASTQALAVQGRRRGSVWMMLLLTDGAPNATDAIPGFEAGFCPPASWPSPARIGQPITITGYYQHQGESPYAEPTCLIPRTGPPIGRTCILSDTKVDKCAPGTTLKWPTAGYQYYYDADDYAHDQADYMANNGIVAFTIGLGSLVTDAPNYLDGNPANPKRDPDGGERLLRYIADMGYDPDVKYDKKYWPCQSKWAWDSTQTPKPTGASCGNYWYAATGNDLRRVFEEIASRLFTRLAK
jgi:hypothetical protein